MAYIIIAIVATWAFFILALIMTWAFTIIQLNSLQNTVDNIVRSIKSPSFFPIDSYHHIFSIAGSTGFEPVTF